MLRDKLEKKEDKEIFKSQDSEKNTKTLNLIDKLRKRKKRKPMNEDPILPADLEGIEASLDDLIFSKKKKKSRY